MKLLAYGNLNIYHTEISTERLLLWYFPLQELPIAEARSAYRDSCRTSIARTWTNIDSHGNRSNSNSFNALINQHIIQLQNPLLYLSTQTKNYKKLVGRFIQACKLQKVITSSTILLHIHNTFHINLATALAWMATLIKKQNYQRKQTDNIDTLYTIGEINIPTMQPKHSMGVCVT